MIHLDSNDAEGKTQTILRLLEHYEEFFQPASRGNLLSSGDVGVALLPSMSRHPSVRELVRVLIVHRQISPTQHAHMMAFFRSEWRTVRPKPKVRFVRGVKTVVESKPETWRRERVLPSFVRLEKVRKGVVFVVLNFHGRPELPHDEMFEKFVEGVAA